jgi:hypothetical protein
MPYRPTHYHHVLPDMSCTGPEGVIAQTYVLGIKADSIALMDCLGLEKYIWTRAQMINHDLLKCRTVTKERQQIAGLLNMPLLLVYLSCRFQLGLTHPKEGYEQNTHLDGHTQYL